MPALNDFLNTDSDIDRLRELLRAGEDPNSRDDLYRTPLHIAVLKCERNPDETDKILLVVRELINSGANVNKTDIMGITPLHFAVMCRNCRVIEMLLEAGAQVNAFSSSASSTLHYASRECILVRDGGEKKLYNTELSVVKLLLRQNPEVDFQDWKNKTPLMFAVEDGNYHIVRELLKKGASAILKDNYKNTAMHYALDREEVNRRVVVELARHGGSFNDVNNLNRTPVVCYLDKLRSNSTRTEVENALHLFKLFVLQGHNFTSEMEISLLKTIHEANRDYNLCDFLDLYQKEVMKMVRSVLVPDWSVFKVANKLAFSSNYGNENDPIPDVALDKLLKKILRKKFPTYFDVMASGICRPYMNLKFAEMCCNSETAISIFDFDVLYLISEYLTNMEKLILMFVCFQYRPSTSLSRLRSLSRCSIS